MSDVRIEGLKKIAESLGIKEVYDDDKKILNDPRAEVFGSKGIVAISNDTDSLAVVSTNDEVASEKLKYFFLERYMQSYTGEIKGFFNAIAEAKIAPVTGVDGLNAVFIGIAAKRIWRRRKNYKNFRNNNLN